MREVDHVKFMKYTINSNNFHSHIVLKINKNHVNEKKLIIRSNVCFKIIGCGHEGYHDDNEENEMEVEDLGIENVNTASVSFKLGNKLDLIFFFFFRMATVYQKVNAICVHTLLSYDDYSQIQICHDNIKKNFNLYRAYPDAEEGPRFMRDMFLKISKSDISKLCHCITKMTKL